MLFSIIGLGVRRFEIDVNNVVTIVARVLMLLLIPTCVEHSLPCIFHRASRLSTSLMLFHFEAIDHGSRGTPFVSSVIHSVFLTGAARKAPQARAS